MSFDFFGRRFYFLSDERQLQKALNMLEKYILKPEILIIAAILATYLVLLCIARFLKKDRMLNFFRSISPWIYMFFILGITVFNRSAETREIRLLPDLWLTKSGFHESTILGFLFNLAIYVPWGYLLFRHLNCCKKWLMSIIVIVAGSLMIEALQYILARGVTAIDDLVANTLGGIIGIFVAIIMQKKHKLE
ncbi:MAG: VanZ family protein [Clostridia bacterium]|nr:VanZ family protein [Clostridia bacterium]